MKIFKKLIFILGVLFLIIALFSIGTFVVIKHLKIKELIERELSDELGLKVSIENLQFSPLLVHIWANGITVYNPKGFEENEFAYISSLHVVFDPLEMITRKKPNIYLFAIDLKRLNIIKNKEGKVNLKELIPIKEASPKKEDPSPLYFDVMVLSVGEINYTEYTAVGKKTRKYLIGLKDQAFVKVIDEDDLARLIVYKAIENTDIGKVINLKIIPVVTGVSDTMSAAWSTAKLGLKSATDIVTFPFKLIFGK